MTKDNKIQRITRLFLIAILVVLPFVVYAQPAKETTIPENNPDFVVVSILYADPGEVLYSTVGHIGIRMECPAHNLDYVFSYESEDVRHKVPAFLAGKLKMGMAAIPYDEYLGTYRAEGRGVKQYILNLPIDAKRNLWKVLDNHMMEGMDLPYDYIKRGCAYSALSMLKEGLDTIRLSYGPWPETFNLTRRELTEIQLKDNYPWTWCFLNLICNGQIDSKCSKEKKVIMPADLIVVLKNASIKGQPLISTEFNQLLPSIHKHNKPFITPTLVSILILLFTVVCAFLRLSIMDYILLSIQTILGIITLYLVFFSNLVCTEWSWLIIPFNPLPLFFWKWRNKWCLPYAIVILLWALVMMVWPHILTDTAYIVLSISIVILYVYSFILSKQYEK